VIQRRSRFSTPPGIEQTAGGGVLSINILDSQGNGVSGASLHITNSTVSPAVNVTTTTDASGNVYLIGAKASVQGYHISFSKGGYFGSQTYAPYPTTSFIPTDVHASVVNSAVNQTTFIIDRSSTLRIMTEDSFGNAIPDIEYRIDQRRGLERRFMNLELMILRTPAERKIIQIAVMEAIPGSWIVVKRTMNSFDLILDQMPVRIASNLLQA
jgi:hypothetical protein